MQEYPLLHFLLTPSTVHTTIRALAKLDVSNNDIPDEQQADLKGICTSKGIDFAL